MATAQDVRRTTAEDMLLEVQDATEVLDMLCQSATAADDWPWFYNGVRMCRRDLQRILTEARAAGLVMQL
jgi:hypothetical protein